MKIVMIDPPAGWQVGFPKQYNPSPDQSMIDWLIKNGYPKGWVFDGMSCRMWEQEIPDETEEYTEYLNRKREENNQIPLGDKNE